MTWDPFGYGAQLAKIQATLTALTQKVGTLMTEDASIAATAADIEAQVTNLNNVLTSVASTVAALLADIQAGAASVTPATMAALQKAQADLDTVTGQATTQAAAEAAEVPPAT